MGRFIRLHEGEERCLQALHVDHAFTASLNQDVRCHCGRMVARIESRGIVIKCNRCGEMVAYGGDVPLGKIE
jgi:hypothetical protein